MSLSPFGGELDPGFRAGFVTILGKPNVGKSTLLNAIIGEKLAIVTAKPQTTRDRLSGVYTDDHCQIVFVDTPGVIEARDRFNESLMNEAREALAGVDIVLHLVDAADPDPAPAAIRALLDSAATDTLLAVNKVDLTPQARSWSEGIQALAACRDEDVFALSALSGQGVGELVTAIARRLPVGPPFYDPEQLCDRDLRYLVAERVREKIFESIQQEVPYGIATQTDEFRERPGEKTFIAVTIYVERDSQKGIVLGRGALMLKQIGQQARKEIEQLLDEPVYLELSVKVRKNWRKNDNALREFGYNPPRPSRSNRSRSGKGRSS